MIIAYPLIDIRSMVSKKTLYQAQGIPTRVIVIMDNVAILENSKGERFSASTQNIIWSDTGP